MTKQDECIKGYAAHLEKQIREQRGHVSCIRQLYWDGDIYCRASRREQELCPGSEVCSRAVPPCRD